MKMSPGRQMGTSLGRQIRTSPGHQMGTSPGRSNRMFRGHSGDVGRGRPRDVLGTNICRLGKLQDISKGITSNKSKHLLVENELKKLEKFDAAYFRGKNYFDVDDTQIYLVFQPIHRYFKTFIKNNLIFISPWESKGLSNEKIGSAKTSNHDQSPRLVYDNARIKLNFSGDLLNQDKITYNHGPIVNIYVVYRLTPRINNSGVTLENCLFGAVKLMKNEDIDKYKYSGYGIGFDSKRSFSHPSGGYGKNVIIFRAGMSSSIHANNKTRRNRWYHNSCRKNVFN